MPAEKFEFHVSFKRLLIGLLITVVPISLAGLYAIEKSDRELRHTFGSHFKIFAESAAQEVSQFVSSRVVDVGVVATEPSIIEVINAANRQWQGVSDSAVTDRIQGIEKGWNTGESDAVVRKILSEPASVRLRRYLELDPRFLRITVTDDHGATVAATHKTQDYFQADEEFWQGIYANGRGAVSVTDILYDNVTNSSYIGIGAPVLEQGTNRFIGAVDALVDVSSLFEWSAGHWAPGTSDGSCQERRHGDQRARGQPVDEDEVRGVRRGPGRAHHDRRPPNQLSGD